jgi:flavorubredoxin
LVIYDTKYGNTKIVAEQITEGIKDIERMETAIAYVKEIDYQKLRDYDALVIGAPNHMGRPSQTMKKFVNNLVEHDLKAKHIAVFGTYSGKVRADRSVKKLEQLLKKKFSSSNIVLPGLSIKVNGVTGPLAEGELPKCKKFGKKIAEIII